MRMVMNVEDFARFPSANAQEHPVLRSNAVGMDITGVERGISFIFSDETVARDGHTISTAGWELQEFNSNPVFLWCHDASAPPIGRVVAVKKISRQLVGMVEFASREQYEFADTIYQLYKAGYLNATSVSWLPLEWKFSTEKGRPRGAVDFIRQTLLEISAVPVPALPTALATARSNGIDTASVYTWAEKVLDGGGMIMIPRSDLEALRKEAKMPTQRAANTPTEQETGTLRTEPPAVPSAAKVQTAPDAQRTAEAKPAALPARRKIEKRGLYEVACLASILASLGYLSENVKYEAEWEGDGSTVPVQLNEAMKALGETLISMTAEEVAEMFTEEVDGVPQGASLKDKLAAFRELNSAIAGGDVQNIAARAGKSLSSKNEKQLRDAHEMMTKGCDMVRGVFDTGDTEDRETVTTDSDAARQVDIRRRRAKARKLRLALK